MSDEDDCVPRALEPGNHLKQAFDLATVEAGGWLVKNQHLAREFDGTGNSDDLLHRDGMGAQLTVRVKVEPVAG